MKQSRQSAANDDSCISTPFSCLPNDVVLEILNKVMDLKTLCVCEIVSKRFYAIAHEVDTICYTTRFTCAYDSFICKSFDKALTSIKKFDRVKSLCIQFPSSTQGSIIVNNNNNNNNDALFKWKVKRGKNRIDSLVFVSAASIYDKKTGLLLYGEEKEDGDRELALKEYADDCFQHGLLYVAMLNHIAGYFPSLEKVSIASPDNRGMVSVNGREKLDELRNWNDVDDPDRKIRCYVPLLELPVLGYVMKGVTLFLMDWNDAPNDVTFDSFINDERYIKHDKQDAPYHEAMMEIFKKHRGSFESVQS